jgi:hypothetical protein
MQALRSTARASTSYYEIFLPARVLPRNSPESFQPHAASLVD